MAPNFRWNERLALIQTRRWLLGFGLDRLEHCLTGLEWICLSRRYDLAGEAESPCFRSFATVSTEIGLSTDFLRKLEVRTLKKLRTNNAVSLVLLRRKEESSLRSALQAAGLEVGSWIRFAGKGTGKIVVIDWSQLLGRVSFQIDSTAGSRIPPRSEGELVVVPLEKLVRCRVVRHYRGKGVD